MRRWAGARALGWAGLRMWLAAAVAAGARGDPTPMDAACKWVGEDGHAVSLAPFKGKEPELYRHVDNGYEYVVNLCGSVDASACASKTPDAVAIQDKIGGKSGCESVIGAVSPTAPPAWSQLGDTGYTISFAGGDGGCEDPPFVRVTAFQLLCDDNVALAELVHVIEDPKCVYTAQFKINCDVARNGGLAGKWSFASRDFFSTLLLVLMHVCIQVSSRKSTTRSGNFPSTKGVLERVHDVREGGPGADCRGRVRLGEVVESTGRWCE